MIRVGLKNWTGRARGNCEEETCRPKGIDIERMPRNGISFESGRRDSSLCIILPCCFQRSTNGRQPQWYPSPSLSISYWLTILYHWMFMIAIEICRFTMHPIARRVMKWCLSIVWNGVCVVAGYLIPKGWKVLAWFRSIHYDKEVYPDPKKFDPSRWDVS